MTRISLLLGTIALSTFALVAIAASDDPEPQSGLPVHDTEGTVIGQYRLPPDTGILAQPNASEILYGKRLLAETARLLPDNVGAAMNCNSCHLADGKAAGANPYINTLNSYPAVMPRAGKEVDIEMRINGCFQRSMNGKALDRDSAEMTAMISYMRWLGQGQAKGTIVAIANAGPIDDSLIPDPNRGAIIYQAQCATCHGAQGEGMRDASGDVMFPPLWGEESFNIGAGMARTYKAAAFVKHAMPPAQGLTLPLGQGGTLTDQDAVDVAEYFTHMPRPDFAGKEKDWSGRAKPKDARY